MRLVSLSGLLLNTAEYGVAMEFPFRPASEYEVRVADVAVFSRRLWEQTADDDYFRGVPAIVMEVLSPWNSASEMLDREEVCLGNGGQEFWLVDPAGERASNSRRWRFSTTRARRARDQASRPKV